MIQEHFIIRHNFLKALLSSLLLLMISIVATAQISVTPNTFDEEYVDVDLSDPLYFVLESTIANVIQDTVVYGWRRVVSAETPSSWVFPIADQNISYLPFISQSPLPLVLYPGDTSGFISLNAFLMDSAGCSHVTLLFFPFDDPGQVLDSITYSIHVNDPDCSTTGTRDISAPAIVALSPNPVNDILYRPDGLTADAVYVYNSFGELVESLSVDATYWNVENWASGVYVVSFIRDGRTVGVGKVVKE